MPSCPECGSTETWKAGFRYVQGVPIQRFLCRSCGYRFSENYYKECQTTNSRQICVTQINGMKNLVRAETETNALRESNQDTKGKIVESLWFLKKKGYKKSTIESMVRRLKCLINFGANLNDPEHVKKLSANDKWKDIYKASLTSAYSSFAKMVGID